MKRIELGVLIEAVSLLLIVLSGRSLLEYKFKLNIDVLNFPYVQTSIYTTAHRRSKRSEVKRWHVPELSQKYWSRSQDYLAAAWPRHDLSQSSSSNSTYLKTKTRTERKMVHTRSRRMMLTSAKLHSWSDKYANSRCVHTSASYSYEHAFL